MTEQARLVAGEITAWRGWATTDSRVDRLWAALRHDWSGSDEPAVGDALYGVGVHRVWPTQRPAAAVCLANVDHGTIEAPAADCECGLYGLPTRDALIDRFLRDQARVNVYTSGRLLLGTTRLWGHTIEHEGGYRAQWAKPATIVRLWNNAEVEHAVAELAARYGATIVDDDVLAERIQQLRAAADAAADESRKAFQTAMAAVQRDMARFAASGATSRTPSRPAMSYHAPAAQGARLHFSMPLPAPEPQRRRFRLWRRRR